MNRIVNFLQKYFAVISVLIGISILLSVTFSSYIVTSNDHKAAEMYIGSLKYSMKIDSNETNTLTVEPGVTIIDVDVNNLNPVDTYYKLLYLNNSNLEIKYFSETKDTDEVKTSYKSPNDSVTSNNTNNLKLFIRNNSDTNQEVSFSLKGGYINNALSDIKVPSGYSEITTIEVPSSNTYFCKTSDTLTQGLEYVNGQYTYGYKKEGQYAYSGINWQSISTNGWGVQLTDKTSTDAVTSKLCTYINNKPIISMSYMFKDSKATTLDLNSFDTSNVTNMYYMFGNSKATTLDLSSFNTSNVTNMGSMFWSSQATTLDLSSFDTSNVTKMYEMFYVSSATSLDLSSFNTSKVTDMSRMFGDSQATTLDLSNFDTSNVTNMKFMFWGSQAIMIKGLENFDTSKVTNMSLMFQESQASTIDVSHFDTSNVTNMSQMFADSKAITLDLSNFDTSKVTNMSSMLSGIKATILDVSSFDTSNVTNMSYMFSDSQATTLDLSNFDTSNVTDMSYMFYNSTKLKTIYVSSKFNTTAVTGSSNMFTACTSLVGGAGTEYSSTNPTDKTYAHIDGDTSNPGYFTDIADKPSEPNSFSTDSWPTIINAVKNNNIGKYNVGDTRTIDMGTYGKHTLRIANTTTPSECSTTGFSQSACGFVIEFADIITKYNMNTTANSRNGWPASSMYTFVNNDIYNALPAKLKSVIIDTIVVSGHGNYNLSNFTSTDKLYLLSPREVWNYSGTYDAASSSTRQLDYYKEKGVSTSNYSGAIKKNGTSASAWWLRTATSSFNGCYYSVMYTGAPNDNNTAELKSGVSPAFRIG